METSDAASDEGIRYHSSAERSEARRRAKVETEKVSTEPDRSPKANQADWSAGLPVLRLF
jgi:hypothetical protein